MNRTFMMDEAWDHLAHVSDVLPASVTRAALQALKDHSGKRLIVHYLQPGAPYPGLDRVDDEGQKGVRAWLLKFLSGICFKTGLLGEDPGWRIRQWLGMEPSSPMDAVRRKYGNEGLRIAYRENLRMVLKEVQGLVRHLAGRIIVTSNHSGGSDDPLLTGIPWLIIDKKDREDLTVSDAGREPGTGESGGEDEAKIKARLKALGYID